MAIRATNSVSYPSYAGGATASIPLPAGSQVGDLAVIFASNDAFVFGGGNSSSLSAGWTPLFATPNDSISGYKVLNGSDISAGTATIINNNSFGGNPNIVIAIAVYVGTLTVRESAGGRTGFISPLSVTTSGAVVSGDGALYYGEARQSPSTGQAVCLSRGQVLQSFAAGPFVGVLNQEGITSNGALTVGFSDSIGAGNGLEGIVVIVESAGQNPAAPAVLCDNPPDGIVSTPYSHAFPPQNLSCTNVFSLTSGSLPTGLTLNSSTGVVSGTPTTPGTSSFTISVSYGAVSGYPSNPLPFSVNVSCSIRIFSTGPPVITCDSPPDGTVGTPYTHTFPASGGDTPYTFSIIAGSLPGGLTLDSATGIVSGTPTTIGTFPFTIQVSDVNARLDSVPCSITIDSSGLTIVCDSPPGGFVGVAYSHVFPASGGTAPYTFAIISGSLPTGLTLNASTGTASGTPTAAGTFPFTIQVTDAAADTATADCSITIAPTLAIICDSPPGAVVGMPYSHAFPASGGIPGYTFDISVPALPVGLTLDPATGIASGTPTLAGTANFTVRVTDSVGETASIPCSITVTALPPPLQIICNNPPIGVVGAPYFHTFPVFGGVGPYTFSIISGVLPDGLTLDTSNGSVSGIPTVAAKFPFTIQVMDTRTATAMCSITITVILSPVVAQCNNPPATKVGFPYDHFFLATGGVPPYQFSISAGMLPDGLSLNPDTGEVTGTAIVSRVFAFTVTVTDSLGVFGSVDCSIAVVPPCPCSKIAQRNAGPPPGLSKPGPLVSSPPQPPPLRFTSADGTVMGKIDGINGTFTVGVRLQRVRVWRNGLFLTLNKDVVAGNGAVKFLDLGQGTPQIPHPNYPQPGDIIDISGWPLP